MRSEQEMMALLLGIAREDPRIRGVILNGSRTNPNAPKDIFQDYDVVYAVTEIESFVNDPAWPEKFGEILYSQLPDGELFHPDDPGESFAYLLQFTDGNRIDLTVRTVEFAVQMASDRGLGIVLLDKDGTMPSLPQPTDAQHWVKKPDQRSYSACCNEFWWCTNNLAKGLWRGEMPYVMTFADSVVRPQLLRMLSWQAAAEHDFSISVGKMGKYLGKYLPQEVYADYLATYFPAEEEAGWEGVLHMCRLFRQTSETVAAKLGFTMNCREADAACSFLEHVRKLPKDAKEIY